jgi:hypothetical protein
MEYHKMKIVEVNCQTGEEVLREATKAEKDEAKARQEIVAAREAEAEAKAAQRQALLSRLGITEEEARILLGGN